MAENETKPDKEAKPKDFTALERLLLSCAPFVMMMEDVILTSSGENPRVHPGGLYEKVQKSVITVTGTDETIQLVGIKVPYEIAAGIAVAFRDARQTPLGVKLTEKFAGRPQ